MNRAIRLSPSARAELLDALEYLEQQQKGLGRRLGRLTHKIVLELRDHPRRFPVIYGRFRRARVAPFQYAVIFAEEVDEIFVAAFFHLRRNPGCLWGRLEG